MINIRSKIPASYNPKMQQGGLIYRNNIYSNPINTNALTQVLGRDRSQGLAERQEVLKNSMQLRQLQNQEFQMYNQAGQQSINNLVRQEQIKLQNARLEEQRKRLELANTQFVLDQRTKHVDKLTNLNVDPTLQSRIDNLAQKHKYNAEFEPNAQGVLEMNKSANKFYSDPEVKKILAFSKLMEEGKLAVDAANKTINGIKVEDRFAYDVDTFKDPINALSSQIANYIPKDGQNLDDDITNLRSLVSNVKNSSLKLTEDYKGFEKLQRELESNQMTEKGKIIELEAQASKQRTDIYNSTTLTEEQKAQKLALIDKKYAPLLNRTKQEPVSAKDQASIRKTEAEILKINAQTDEIKQKAKEANDSGSNSNSYLKTNSSGQRDKKASRILLPVNGGGSMSVNLTDTELSQFAENYGTVPNLGNLIFDSENAGKETIIEYRSMGDQEYIATNNPAIYAAANGMTIEEFKDGQDFNKILDVNGVKLKDDQRGVLIPIDKFTKQDNNGSIGTPLNEILINDPNNNIVIRADVTDKNIYNSYNVFNGVLNEIITGGPLFDPRDENNLKKVFTQSKTLEEHVAEDAAYANTDWGDLQVGWSGNGLDPTDANYTPGLNGQLKTLAIAFGHQFEGDVKFTSFGRSSGEINRIRSKIAEKYSTANPNLSQDQVLEYVNNEAPLNSKHSYGHAFDLVDKSGNNTIWNSLSKVSRAGTSDNIMYIMHPITDTYLYKIHRHDGTGTHLDISLMKGPGRK